MSLVLTVLSTVEQLSARICLIFFLMVRPDFRVIKEGHRGKVSSHYVTWSTHRHHHVSSDNGLREAMPLCQDKGLPSSLKSADWKSRAQPVLSVYLNHLQFFCTRGFYFFSSLFSLPFLYASTEAQVFVWCCCFYLITRMRPASARGASTGLPCSVPHSHCVCVGNS